MTDEVHGGHARPREHNNSAALVFVRPLQRATRRVWSGWDDAAEAFRLYLKAAEQDHVPSQRKVAELYAEGKGVEKNPVEAERWSRKYTETAEKERKALER